MSSEHAKGKTKSSTEVVSHKESKPKVSNVGPSKSQTKAHKKASKDVVVAQKKAEAKTEREDTRETRVDDVEVTQGTRLLDTQMNSVENAKGVDEAGSQVGHTEYSKETSVDDAQSDHVDDTRIDRVTVSQETHAKASQVPRVSDAQESSSDARTQEQSEHNLEKTESDLEVVVHVYVPDEVKADDPDQVPEQTSQESGDKAEHPEGVGATKHVTKSGVNKVDLKFCQVEPDVSIKKVSSRRAFGDSTIEKNLVNIVPRNSMDMIKGIKLTPMSTSEIKPVSSRSFNSRGNLPRAPAGPKTGSRRRNPPETRAIKVSNFELPQTTPMGVLTLKQPAVHGKPQISVHRLASKMSTNLEKVDEGFALETSHSGTLTSKESGKLVSALNISKASVTSKPATDKDDNGNSREKVESQEENAEKKTEKVWRGFTDIF